MKHTHLSKRLSELERVITPKDSGVIVCDVEDYERLHAEHPESRFIIDNIPRTIKEVQDNVLIYEPGADPGKLQTLNANDKPLFFLPDNGRDQ
jgi:hypothetical protein